MAQRVCPWWHGYMLACPLRRLMNAPAKILASYVHEGMTVLEPGPGMGFFTLELARLVGPRGRVVVVDMQSRMLDGLKKRVAKAGLLERVDARLVSRDSMGLADLAGAVDFALAYYMVHELPSADVFFAEIAAALRPGGCLLLAEPAGHVNAAKFADELKVAAQAGLEVAERPSVGRSSRGALLKKA